MKICVIGLGYIGLPTATMLANAGLNVVGVDTNPEVVNRTNRGVTSIKERGFNEILGAVVKSGKLKAQADLPIADCFIICVPTPFSKTDKSATLSHVKAAASSVAKKLRKGNIVILESTVPPGTTEDILKNILEKGSGLEAARDFFLAHSPERLLPGKLLHELIYNDRIIGGLDVASALGTKKIYEKFVHGNIHLSDTTTTEFVKLMENTFGAVNIALVNEFARIAEKLGLDIHEAIRLANRHPRVRLFKPGPGVGGHCIPVDPWFIVALFPNSAKLIRAALEVNERMPEHVINAVSDAFTTAGKRIKGARIAVLGAAYKGNIGDTRESPSQYIVNTLSKKGAKVVVHDPYVEDFIVPVERNLMNAVKNADALLLITDHDEYAMLEPRLGSLKKVMKAKPIIIDARNMLAHAPGFIFWKLGIGFLQ